MRYPWYYRGNGYKFYGITAVLGSEYAGIPWGYSLWGWVVDGSQMDGDGVGTVVRCMVMGCGWKNSLGMGREWG